MGNRDLERDGIGGEKSRNNNSSYPPPSPYYVEVSESEWTPWMVPMIVVANVAMFVVIMYVNNCHHNYEGSRFGKGRHCVAKVLGRLSFQPLQENPLFGPSSSTYFPFKTQSFICFLLFFVWLRSLSDVHMNLCSIRVEIDKSWNAVDAEENEKLRELNQTLLPKTFALKLIRLSEEQQFSFHFHVNHTKIWIGNQIVARVAQLILK